MRFRVEGVASGRLVLSTQQYSHVLRNFPSSTPEQRESQQLPSPDTACISGLAVRPCWCSRAWVDRAKWFEPGQFKGKMVRTQVLQEMRRAAPGADQPQSPNVAKTIVSEPLAAAVIPVAPAIAPSCAAAPVARASADTATRDRLIAGALGGGGRRAVACCVRYPLAGQMSSSSACGTVSSQPAGSSAPMGGFAEPAVSC